MTHTTLMVVTDGRDCLRSTLSSFEQMVDQAQIDRRIIVNCCARPAFIDWIDSLGFDVHLRPGVARRGFAGAIQAGWHNIGETDFIFHLEDDFSLQRTVDLSAMIDVLQGQPRLQQLCLRRQPWNEEEIAAGGIIECHPEDFTDRDDGEHHWIEHRRFFSTNPCLYRADLIKRGWPDAPYSEGMFGVALLEDPQAVCGFWGQRTDPPWVIHTGLVRTGTGY